jgi:outer membrane immunogenic protein
LHQQQAARRGYFGTAGGGYDWQLSQRWVSGIFGDGQFGGVKGSVSALVLVANVKL